jgi:hypothetical protein
LGYAIKRFFGDRRSSGGVDIEEFAPHMRPAAGLDNPTADEQFVEPGEQPSPSGWRKAKRA